MPGVPVEVGQAYAIKDAQSTDSTLANPPYAIRVERTPKVKREHQGRRVFWSLIGRKVGRRKSEGSWLFTTFDRNVLRKLTDEEVAAVERA